MTVARIRSSRKQNYVRECDRKKLTVAKNHVLRYVYDVLELAISRNGAFQGPVKQREIVRYIRTLYKREI